MKEKTSPEIVSNRVPHIDFCLIFGANLSSTIVKVARNRPIFKRNLSSMITRSVADTPERVQRRAIPVTSKIVLIPTGALI